ncbi:MAG: hypothetical protein ACRC7V_03600 [Lachnospiraceae bacterium]
MTKKTKIIPADATKILTCVNDIEFSEPKGTWTSLHNNICHSFDSAVDLLMQIDEHYDENGFVQHSLQHRSYSKKESFKKATIKNNSQNIYEKNGEKATFVVQVMFRQNATWQGKVKWVETGKEIIFRSTLELLKLMDEALAVEKNVVEEKEGTA